VLSHLKGNSVNSDHLSSQDPLGFLALLVLVMVLLICAISAVVSLIVGAL
jgi:hypothetical protein